MYTFSIIILLITIIIALVVRNFNAPKEKNIFLKIEKVINLNNIYVWIICVIVCTLIVGAIGVVINMRYGHINSRYYSLVGALAGIFFMWKLRKNKE